MIESRYISSRWDYIHANISAFLFSGKEEVLWLSLKYGYWLFTAKFKGVNPLLKDFFLFLSMDDYSENELKVTLCKNYVSVLYYVKIILK